LSNGTLTTAGLFENIPDGKNFINPVVTIGSFDGVHIGHKKIINALFNRAREKGGDPIVITFETHPRLFLNPEYSLKLITTNDEKTDILKSMGIKQVLMLRFSREMADLSALDFYNSLLIQKLGVKNIIIGYDHAFGKDREGGIELLQKLGDENGIDIEQVEEELIDGRAVSSTWIRDELAEGNTVFANRLLGRAYSIGGYVVRGEGRGRLLGYPTANIQPGNDKKIVPADGVYAVTALVDGFSKELPGMLNIGTNPTFDGKKRTIEVNIFDFNADLYGKEMTIFFHERVRGENKFNGVDELKAQLKIDMQSVKKTLGKDKYKR